MAKITKCKYNNGEVLIIASGKNGKVADAHKSKLDQEERRVIRNDATIIVEAGTLGAKFYVDASCFEDNKLPKNKVNWSIVYQEAFADAKKSKVKNKKIDPKLWALAEGSTAIDYYGMGKNYKNGNELTVSVVSGGKSLYYYGYYQQVLLFTKDPKESFKFYIIPVTTPSITFAYFKDSERKWQYGDVVKLSVHFHNVHSPSEAEKIYARYFVVEDNEKNKKFGKEIKIEDIDVDDLEEASVWYSEISIMPDIQKYYGRGANQQIENDILIDYEKWRKEEHKEKQFSVIALTYKVVYRPFITDKIEIVLFKNFLNEPTNNVYEYETSIIGVNDVDAKKNSVSSRIIVNADFMSEILKRKEDEKTTMIQYIGDIEFKQKEFDPCGFSKIIINEGEEVNELEKGKRLPITLFDEDAGRNKIDHTSTIYDIIAGDSKKKKILITLKNLQNKNVICNGVMLPDHTTHETREHVFQMNKVTLPFLNEKGHYVVDRDNSSKDKVDYDYRKSDIQTDDVSKTQGWLLGTDYDYKGEDKLQLKLGYIFNKHMLEDSPIRNWGLAIGELAEEIMDNIWMFNYFFLTDDKAQSYFVPIGTCRYPHQIVKVRVFPNIKWEVFVLIKPQDESDFYTYSGMPDGDTKYKEKINKKHWDKAIKATKNGKIESRAYTGELHIKCTVSDEVFDLGVSMEKNLNKILDAIVSIKKILDTICHRNVAAEAQSDVKKVVPQVSKAISAPIFLDFSLPTVKLGGEWRFDVPDMDSPMVRCIGSLKIGFEPLIKAKGGIDLLAVAAKIIPVGLVLKGLGYVQTFLGWISDKTGAKVELELVLNLYAKGEIKYGYTIDFLHPKEAKSELKLALAVGIEFGFTIKAVIVKVEFVAGNAKGKEKKIGGFEGSLTAEGEVGFEGTASDGYDKQGHFVQFKLDFLGLTLKITGKLTTYNKTGKPNKKGVNIKENLVDRYDEILKTDKMYVL